MALDPGLGHVITATVTKVNGNCIAGHKEGDSFEISTINTAGLCGFFYHDIFPALSTFQFGGNYPWWNGDTIELKCPDQNIITLSLTRTPRDAK